MEQQINNILNSWLKFGVIRKKGNSLVWTSRTLKEMTLEQRCQLPEDAAKQAVEEYQKYYQSKKVG